MPAAFTNRLARESSPYLRQHAHNPVDWYAWGAEAFAQARRRDCPIFLSVGYSTCYWCHVMERESFENPQIAAELNRHFVNIKVDREERPDVDQLYMTAVQFLTRSGGWPMNLFLTPDLRPFYGGTYFPPADAQGRMGFPGLIDAIAHAWSQRRQEVQTAAGELVEALGQYGSPPAAAQTMTIDAAMVDTLVGRSAASYDRQNGGFGTAPKFPQETLLELLLAYSRRQPGSPMSAKLREMARHTLEAMARGGIRDQLGGGFHRYSTDAAWRVPHFEIMLYDNALLAPLYAEAGQDANDPWLQEVARGICDFVLRKMTSSRGGFFTAFDAEVDAREGEPYLWTAQEVAAVLPAGEAALFGRVYGLSRGPNFADPHHGSGTPDRNVLYLPLPLAAAAQAEGLTLPQLEARLAPLRSKLLTAREQRKQPGLDTKILTSWNALMVRGLVRCAVALQEPRYLEAAMRAGRYLLACHCEADGTILRTPGTGEARLSGTLEDYAFLALALLALQRATGEGSWRDAALRILESMERRFGGGGAYYSTAAGESDIIVRQQIGQDSPLPSGNGAAAQAWLEAERPEKARPILAAFALSLEQQGEAMSALALAAMTLVAQQGTLHVPPRGNAGAGEAADPASLAQAVVQASLAAVDDFSLRLTLRIRQGWHIQDEHAAGGVAATQVVTTGELTRVTGVRYPPAEDGRYTGEVAITVSLSTPAAPGLEVVLVYQPCSDEACLPVVRKTLRLPENAAAP